MAWSLDSATEVVSQIICVRKIPVAEEKAYICNECKATARMDISDNPPNFAYFIGKFAYGYMKYGLFRKT